MRQIRFFSIFGVAAALIVSLAGNASALTRFTEVSALRGVAYQHAMDEPWAIPEDLLNGGVAVGDYDSDGRVDLFVIRGEFGGPQLLRNPGNGPFEDKSVEAGLDLGPGDWSGPAFGDINGDGHLDLVIGGTDGQQPRIFQNDGDGTFTEVTVQTGIVSTTSPNTYSTSFGDYDRDGDLDLLMAHWTKTTCTTDCMDVLWRNNGDGTFTNVQASVGIVDPSKRTFSLNFADINNDRWPDLLFTSDFGNSQTYINDGDGTFTETTDELVITDEYGMGTAVGDYDNDGYLDWLNTSVFGLLQEGTGNRLYRNLGDGTFEDTTDDGATGVRDGSFGWSACFADFNNDMHLDIFHTNGMAHQPTSMNDPARLFMADGNGGFDEQAAALQLNDLGAGKGVVCFDFDNDGDMDIFTANNNGLSALHRNDGGNDNNFLKVELRTRGKNRFAVGARVYVTVGAVTQMREIRLGTNFQSQNPLQVHFGLATAATADEVRIEWFDGDVDTYTNVAANQTLDLDQAFKGYLGVYDPANGRFLLTNSNAGTGTIKVQVTSNGLGLAPVSGDWSGDAIDTIGLFDDAAMEFKLWNTYANGVADITVPLGAGTPGSRAISGDWDGDGYDTVGIYDPTSAMFHFWNSTAGGAPDVSFFKPGGAGWIPIAGDWNGDGVDTYGFYDPAGAFFYLRNTNDRGAWDRVFHFGPRNQDMRPVVGDWNKDGVDTIGVHNRLAGKFSLRNSNASGPPEIVTSFGWRGPGIAATTRSWVFD